MVRTRFEVALRYYDDTGTCIYCSLRDRELVREDRVVMKTEQFAVFHPYASRMPFETWVIPMKHSSCFCAVTDEEIEDLARVLKTVLRKLYDGLGNPDYNLIVFTAPTDDEQEDHYEWHIQILPRLTLQAGFELGTGMFINTAFPEETAQFMRDFQIED
jgi:UDPglucose--hexose-1-phosphate uridylyltransferase